MPSIYINGIEYSGAGKITTTAILNDDGWDENLQTINVNGVTSTNSVIVGPSKSSTENYISYGIACKQQGSGTLTFSCKQVPSVNISVDILILN